MKIGIITTFRANNYGAELQAYATQQKLRNLGHDAELIDYLFYKNRKHRYSPGSQAWRKFSLKIRVKHFILYRLALPLLDIFGNALSGTMRLRTENFKKFHAENSHTSRVYYSQKELYDAQMDYDAYCVGSDQVWNPNTATSIEPHFLTFAPKDKLKFSYASSFGVSELEESIRKRYIDGLNNLDYISCRERQGVNLVKSLTGREAVHVLDPTLLLSGDEWRQVASYKMCPDKGKYILLYNIVELDPIYQLALRISSETGYPIVKLCKRALMLKSYQGVTNLPSAGPADFIGLIDNAYLFLTNSFHGFAFAVNLHTPMWAIMDSEQKNNSRLESIASVLKLQNRLLDSRIDLHSLNYKEKVDFEVVCKRLEVEKQKSMTYIESVLNQSLVVKKLNDYSMELVLV